MDLATLLGIVIGLGLVIGSILIGPDPIGFIDVPSMMIVLAAPSPRSW